MTTATTLAATIAADFLHERVESVTPLLGLGIVNQIFVVQTSGTTVVVRMNDDARAQQDYAKERWCMEQAAAHGVPGPQVLVLGERENFAYMLQTFATGTHGADPALDSQAIWRALGQYAQRIHAIPVVGYGEQLADGAQKRFAAPTHPGFDGTWSGFIQYNVESLTAQDPLLTLGVLTQAQAKLIRQQFEALHAQTFTFGLTHGDLSLKNTIVDPAGQVILLDWGSAEVHITPHWEIIQLLDGQTAVNISPALALQAFLDGYGLSADEFAAHQPILWVLRLLRALDKVRWALDCCPEKLPNFATAAQQLIQRYFDAVGVASC